MDHKNLLSKIILLASILLLTNFSYAKIITEEDMAKAVVETIKTNNSDSISSYCVSTKKMMAVINSVTDTTAIAKSVLSELKTEDYQKTNAEVIVEFNKFIEELKKNNINFKDAKFEGVISNKIKFDIGDLASKKVLMNISFGKEIYTVSMYMFKGKTNLLIYGFSFWKEDKQ